MPQNLISDITVNLGPGATITLPHGLTAPDNTPLIPFEVRPDRGTPILVTATTATDVTFNNPDAAPQTAIFRAWRYHSEIAPTATPSLRWQGSIAGGGGGGGTQYSYLWQPNGGINAGNQFETLSAIVAASAAIPGPISIAVDASLNGGNAVVDTPGVNLQKYQIIGLFTSPLILPTLVLDGVVCQAPYSVHTCRIRSQGAGGTFNIGSGQATLLFNCQTETTVIGVPAIRKTGGGFGAILLNSGSLGNSVTADTLVVDVGNTLVGNIQGTTIRPNCVNNAGTMDIQADASVQIETPQTNWPGGNWANISGNIPQMSDYAYGPVSGVANLDPLASIVLVDNNGGPATIILPVTSSYSIDEGRSFTIKVVTAGSNDVTIQAGGADLIDGSATHVIPGTLAAWAEIQITAVNGGQWSVRQILPYSQAGVNTLDKGIRTGDATITSGNITHRTGDSAGALSGDINLTTGDAAAGDSGDINLTIGTAGIVRGRIRFQGAAQLQAYAETIVEVAPASFPYSVTETDVNIVAQPNVISALDLPSGADDGRVLYVLNDGSANLTITAAGIDQIRNAGVSAPTLPLIPSQGVRLVYAVASALWYVL